MPSSGRGQQRTDGRPFDRLAVTIGDSDDHLGTAELERDLKACATGIGHCTIGPRGDEGDLDRGATAGDDRGEQRRPFGAHRQTERDVLDHRSLDDPPVLQPHRRAHREPGVGHVGVGARRSGRVEQLGAPIVRRSVARRRGGRHRLLLFVAAAATEVSARWCGCIEMLQQFVGGEFDRLVAPFRSTVDAGDQRRAVDPAEITADECVAGFRLVVGTFGEPEMPGCVGGPSVAFEVHVLRVGVRLDLAPTAVEHVLVDVDQVAGVLHRSIVDHVGSHRATVLSVATSTPASGSPTDNPARPAAIGRFGRRDDGYPPSVRNDLPAARPSTAVVESVGPVVDGGRHPAKASVGELVQVDADVFAAGHVKVAAALLVRAPGEESWSELPMADSGNDRRTASFVPDKLGRWEYDVVGWVDHVETWRLATIKKVEAGVDVELDLAAGVGLLGELVERAAQLGNTHDHGRLEQLVADLTNGDTALLDDPGWTGVSWRNAGRTPFDHLARPLEIDVDRELARFGAWYEFFPRSAASPAHGPQRLRDAIGRLDRIAAMGFDIVYLPPVHPIGRTKRKGRNNTTEAASDDVGSPWAIGSTDGGHLAVDPSLGTVEDVSAFAAACRERGLELALDIAFQCSPDHPWVTEHPDWFAHRADGSIQFAENPPKRYEDIFPLDFESDDWRNLWEGLAEVFRFWIAQGVTIFRVDNPHTKAFAFWEWALGTLRAEHPETIFLAEAFTRPRVMERLAKIGFNQSYTYFAWRQVGWELEQYFSDLGTRTVDYFRPNAWPNTPDILTEQLQHGGRPTFISRAVLAATLSPSWGIYGPAFELQEHTAVRPGSEEYLDSEKYQLRTWNLDADGTLEPLLARLNEIRRQQPALRELRTIHFHPTDDPDLLCFSKTAPGLTSPIVVVVNLDATKQHAGFVDLDLAQLGMPYGASYEMVDLLSGGTYHWHGNHNYVELAPWSAMAHVFEVHQLEDAHR